jgi:hypothetical protein
MEKLISEVGLFLKYFGRFEPYPKSEKEFAFYKNYGEPNLTILILIENLNIKPIIRSCIKVTKNRYCYWTRDTLVKEGWKSVLAGKIENLERIIKGTVVCSQCNVWKIPLVRRNHKTGTNFVAYYCPKCNERTNTQYGIGIKTDMHSLPRRKGRKNAKSKQKIPETLPMFPGAN